MIWNGPLQESFPSFYAIAGSKVAEVAEVWEKSRGKGVWNPSFVISFHD